MTKVTVKQLGDKIRADLKAAQKSGDLPEHVDNFGYVRYAVRATNGKNGPAVNVTIDGVEPLIPGYPNLTTGAASEWLSGEGERLRHTVEIIRNRYNPLTPVYGGTTKFGPICISAVMTDARTVVGP